MATAAEMVTTIETAITALVTKQVASWTIDGVTYTAQKLTELESLLKHYEAKASQASAVAAGTPRIGLTKMKTGSGK